MAAYSSAQPPVNVHSTASDRPPSSKRLLPNGPCNYRDQAIGPCGCHQFWDKCSADLHTGSEESRPSNERSTWCVCGHHACFHQPEPRPAPERPPVSPALINNRVHNECDGSCQLHQGHGVHGAALKLKQVAEDCPSVGASQSQSTPRSRSSQMGFGKARLRQRTAQVNPVAPNRLLRESSSLSTTTGLPRVPSVCLVSSQDLLHPLQHSYTRQVRNSRTDQTRDQYEGLGLMNLEGVGDPTDRPQSVSSTVPDDVDPPRIGFESEPEIASTRANSARSGSAARYTPMFASKYQPIDFKAALPQLNVGDTIPDTFNPEDLLQSATEIATPSNANTPDLRVGDQALEESKRLVEALAHFSNVRDAAELAQNMQNSGTVTTLPLEAGPSIPPEPLQNALASGPSQVLQQVVSYLNPLHNLLNSIPNVANSIQDLAARMDALEQASNSFIQTQPDEILHQFDHFEGRVLDLEGRMDDHEKLHAAIDTDNSSLAHRRRLINPNESFGSNHTGSSVTSSALIVAALDRKEMGAEIESVKARLDVLEAAAMPSIADPWEVEVVLLPWGPDLRGIWFTPDEPMHDPTSGITQDTEEWTQSRSVRSSSRSSLPFSPSGNGWSSQAISDWADTTEEWLSPKACGTNNLVYKRLRSRGFIRNVTIKSANAGDIQTTLSSAFSDLLQHLEYAPTDNAQDMDLLEEGVNSYPGLKAPFIPLRKVMKSSRLRFLTHAEMSSSALWTAQFLASGVMMRVSGARKRLYVTQREAYLQQRTASEDAWTWQRLRELPRFSTDSDSLMEGNEQTHVPEKDAKEACWAFHAPYDQAPASVITSFSSSHSGQLSLRPADRPWRRSITPASILKNRQPISPLSEFPSRPPSHRRGRTFSNPLMGQRPQSSSKRRLHQSFDHVAPGDPGVPESSSRSGSRSTNNMPLSRPKRRRLTRSPSPAFNEGRYQAQVAAWTNNTPRRSREPPSPFFSSHPELPRSVSDVTNRSQRSAGVISKGTPFAYATPHSGPVHAGHAGFGEGFADDSREGDTEAEGDDDGDDAGSWHGVGGDEEDPADVDNGHSSPNHAELSSERDDPASFSDDEGGSGFGSDEDDQDDDLYDYGGYPIDEEIEKRHHDIILDDEEEEEESEEE